MRDAFERHYLPLLRFCILLSGGREPGEDIAQEAFVRAARALPRLQASEVGPYLRRTAINLWKNERRKLAIAWRVRAAGSPTPSQAAASVEDRAALWQAILRLPVRQRACVVLHYYEDLPERQIAEILRCSVGTVKSHTSRALRRLRKEMAHGD